MAETVTETISWVTTRERALELLHAGYIGMHGQFAKIRKVPGWPYDEGFAHIRGVDTPTGYKFIKGRIPWGNVRLFSFYKEVSNAG